MLIAAAEHAALEEPFEPTSRRYAVVLAGGASLFLLGTGMFRSVLRLGAVAPCVVLGVVALASVPLGSRISPAAQIAALVVVVAAAVLASGRRPET